jgi:hypothetical protein
MIKELVAKIGLDNSGFVGTMKQTIGMVQDAKKGFADLGKGLKESVNGFKASATASNLFKVALASTGIGLIVIALGSLIAYLTTTQAGMDKLRQVIEPVKQIFERLLGVLQNLGGNVFKGIAQMLNGELKEGFKTLSEGAKQAGKETVGAFKEGAKAGKELANITKQIQLAQIEEAKAIGDINREKAKQAEIARDVTKSEKERRDAANKVIELINRETALKDKVLALQVKEMKLRQEANDTDRAAQLELIELQNQRKDLEASASMERIRFNNIIGRNNEKLIEQGNQINQIQREAIKLFDASGMKRDPFAFSESSKHTKETLEGVKKISDNLLKAKTKNAKIQYSDEGEKAFEANNERVEKATMLYTNLMNVSGMLTTTFQGMFNAIIEGGNPFKYLIEQVKRLVIQLLSAVAVASILNALLGGAGVASGAGGTFGGKEGFKSLFSMFSGFSLPKFAKGGMVTGLTTAVLGDNPSGKEAVIPFERMGSFLNQFGGGNQNMKVEVVGVVRGEDIYLSNSNYLQRKNRTLGF